jgi:hypothetical protein
VFVTPGQGEFSQATCVSVAAKLVALSQNGQHARQELLSCAAFT